MLIPHSNVLVWTVVRLMRVVVLDLIGVVTVRWPLVLILPLAETELVLAGELPLAWVAVTRILSGICRRVGCRIVPCEYAPVG